MNNFEGKSIIFFDGVCNLCNASVNFIIKHDIKKHFLFASLQSDVAKEILLHYNLKKIKLDSIILLENDKIYDKSTAALKIGRKLNNGIFLVYGFILIPKFIRDYLYNYIATNRYKWYGKKESCMLPTKDLKSRFL
jgi:predicted DCC family thiol-disulfide oxidoreductase YuxK